MGARVLSSAVFGARLLGVLQDFNACTRTKWCILVSKFARGSQLGISRFGESRSGPVKVAV
jgi:hypothetical protein